jgi:hypothetical protein
VLITVATDPMATKKEALNSFVDLGKQQITLASAIIAFTATFIKDVTKSAGSDAPDLILFIGWGSLFVSILSGLLFHGRSVRMWSDSDLDVDDNLLSRLGQVQQVTFVLGIALILIFVGIEL